MDDGRPAKGKMGPAGYTASLRAIRDAAQRTDLPEMGEEPPEIYADDRVLRRSRRILDDAENE